MFGGNPEALGEAVDTLTDYCVARDMDKFKLEPPL